MLRKLTVDEIDVAGSASSSGLISTFPWMPAQHNDDRRINAALPTIEYARAGVPGSFSLLTWAGPREI